MTDFRRSELWQATLKARDNDAHESQRERLRAAYDGFWGRAVRLAQRISNDLPGLTLHDEEHLAALWDRASQLTGPDYQINPLEAFVFGAAVLLHDAGHAVAAYEGGLTELKQTLEYRDAVAAILRKQGANPPAEDDIANPSKKVAESALFVALRRLHAKQAEVLVTRAFHGNYLIDDLELRDNLAQLIGRVAASHHWDRDLLDQKLPELQGAPGSMPQEWSIQPIKIACLLRCSDAIQIDQRRAPAFALAIHAPQGQSLLHWLAQQLAQPIVKAEKDGGPGALVFTSQRDFTEDKADAWWIAHDLVKNAHEELQGCYQLMKDTDLPAFTVDRVAGAESPLQLERHIRTAGWRPVSAEVRVSSVEQIVSLFGGRLLYGRDPSVALRELIQNASDAVRARRALAADPLYEGKVVVSLKKAEEGDSWQLVVEDDGIGMSERVLTGPLLEFGKSFWASEEAQDEFPGLVSAKLHQAGRYGIGFFSTLMIAQRIEVTSRRWDAAQEQARKLTFREGLRLRPLISETGGASLGQFSTRVALHITSDDAERLLTVSRARQANPAEQDNLRVTLRELVAHLCLCLDCDVLISQPQGHFEVAHSRKWYDSDALQWARQIVFAGNRADQTIDDYLAMVAPLIRVIIGPDGEPCGRAAIGFRGIDAGIDSVGGLVASRHSRVIGSFSIAYVGAIGFEPSGPRRDSGPPCSRAGVEAWASEQALLVAQITVSDLENYVAAMNVAAFGGDPTPIATILINRKPASLIKVHDTLSEGKEVFAAFDASTGRGPRISMIHHWQTPYYAIGFDWNELNFLVVAMEAWSGTRASDEEYHRCPTTEEPAPSCFLSCLQRYAHSKGRTLKMEIVSNVLLATYKGEASSREHLSVGTELRADAIKLSLV
jgi:hypothetical protein